MTERVRTTISLDPHALEVFKRMAEAGNMSVSRCMGDWLSDTVDAAEMITLKMEEAKRAPLTAMREMRALVSGLAKVVEETDAEVRQAHRLQGAQRRAAGESGAHSPSGNTGVLVHPETMTTIAKISKGVGKKS